MDKKIRETAEFVMKLRDASKPPEEVETVFTLAKALLEEAAEVERLEKENERLTNKGLLRRALTEVVIDKRKMAGETLADHYCQIEEQQYISRAERLLQEEE